VARGAWDPAIRREQSLSRAADAVGHDVRFIGPRSEVKGSIASRLLHPDGTSRMVGSITVIERGLELPSHRSNLIVNVSNHLIRRVLHPKRCEGTVAIYRPWEWEASKGAPRRIFDCVDPWPDLLPDAAPLIRDWCRRITEEADEIIVVTDGLAELFPGRKVRTVTNAVDDHLLVPPVQPPPGDQRLLYLGSIGHRRLDLELVDGILTALPGWKLDLVGSSFLSENSPSMTKIRGMEARHSGRLRLLPAVDGDDLIAVIDGCDLMVAPFVPGITNGQSSKKTFDAAARGRSIVTSPGVSIGGGGIHPDHRVADGLDEWVEAIERGPSSSAVAEQTRAWAEQNSWTTRFEEWERWAFS